MTKLYNQIPIETWKKIAYKVQRLKISDCSDYEFKQNLKLLQKLLLDDDNINLSLNEGKRKPKNLEEIGLASLLHSIYTSNNNHILSKECIKSNFYEYIYALNDLGLTAMEYRPIGFDGLGDTLTIGNIADPTKINRKKIYTNGTFKLKYYNGYFGTVVKLEELKNATFLINVVLNHVSNHRDGGYAIVKNFFLDNNMLPSKEELDSIEFPKLIAKEQVVKFGECPEYSQIYDTINLEKLSCSKRLTKTPKGVYYYKESHNK